MESLMISSERNANKTILPGNNFSIIINEIFDINSKSQEDEEEKQNILNCISKYNVTLQELYNWLLHNQNNSNFTVVLANFNYLGIGTNVDKQKVFELLQEAATLGNALGIRQLGYCYEIGIGTSVNKKKHLNYIN